MTGAVPDAAAYAERAGNLYSTAVPQEIDYPVYSVSEENGSVTVTLSDMRNPYVKYWAYFKTVYRFVFTRRAGNMLLMRAVGRGRGRKDWRKTGLDKIAIRAFYFKK